MTCSTWSPNGSSSLVFAIPELMSLICGLVDRNDCIRLMRVSRLLFYSAMPYVWSDVVGVTNIVALLPGAEIEHRPKNRRFHDPEGLEEETVMRLPQQPDLSRLSMYAPCVRSFEFSELPRRTYRVEGDWPAFCFSTTNPGLLPNLQHLSLTTMSESMTEEHVNWLSLFLCPSLQSLRMVSWYSHKRLWLDVDQHPNVMPDIARICPTLERLEIFPRRNKAHAAVSASRVHSAARAPQDQQASSSGIQLFDPVFSFECLRQITGSRAFLDPELFSSIGKLPLLDSLFLYDSTPEQPISQPISAPNDSFPALQRLELHRLNARAISHICGLEPLVRSLTAAVIKFPFIPKGSQDSLEHDPFQSTIRSLSSFATKLVDLTVYLQGGSRHILIDNSTIAAFQRLPLRALALSEVVLAPSLGWEEALAAVPNIESLHLSCSVRINELEVFSERLSKLRHLELRFIDLEPAADFFDGSLQKKKTQVNTPVCLEGELYIRESSSDALGKAAKYLSCLWPTVYCAHRAWDTPANIRTVKALNESISESLKTREGKKLPQDISPSIYYGDNRSLTQSAVFV